MNFPSFDDRLPFLNKFILQLVEGYHAGIIDSWEVLEENVKTFFTPERMNQTEIIVPGWRTMASYANGVTLAHVMCVFLGLYMMPEFQAMTTDGQQMMKWVILFHDVEKQPEPGKRDHLHAFRSAAAAARVLPKLGFPITEAYESVIDEWDVFTRSALSRLEHSSDDVQDNGKLPEILQGIEHMFGHNTPATLIIKTILFHLCVDMEPWPPATPLTDDEVASYFDRDLATLLKAMNLGDGEGWGLFDASRESLRNATLEAFKKVERLIAGLVEDDPWRSTGPH